MFPILIITTQFFIQLVCFLFFSFFFLVHVTHWAVLENWVTHCSLCKVKC